MDSIIPYGQQEVSDDDIDAVVNVLRSSCLTQGLVVPKFEHKVSEYVGSKYAVAVNSGTSALHIACLSLGLGKGDYLWTTPITFVASSNCALYCGAKVDFVDIDSNSWNMSVELLSEKLKKAKDNNMLPKVVVVVHLCGLSCEMEQIQNLAKKYKFYIIEDACHALGGKYQNQMIGNCRYSDITVFSFHPVKNITTGEGGMAVTNNRELFKHMCILRSHGITRDPSEMIQGSDYSRTYQQIDIGFNYRMTDIQAALGISQLVRLDGFIQKRHQIAKIYNKSLDRLFLKLPIYNNISHYSGLHLYVIRTKGLSVGHNKELFNILRSQGVGVNKHYIPVYRQPYYSKFGFKIDNFNNAELYYKEAITLPIFPSLTKNNIKYVVDIVNGYFQ
jgi:UDP-4-amino-4,6-dideoxy-N-acetyl-beta-L-altrosamine transaminase